MRSLLLKLFSHRFLAIARWELYFLRLRFWNAITFQRSRIAATITARQAPLYLNLGSGPRGMDDPHWVNVDGYRDCNVHFLLDMSRDLPIADNTFDGVFCEHVLEHFSLEVGERLAREIRRVLKPRGCLRVVVPDAELVMRRYFDAPRELVARRDGGDELPMETVNAYFRQRYEHQFLYDWPAMEKMLTGAGYGTVMRATFGLGALCQPVALDDRKYEWESLYVEAMK